MPKVPTGVDTSANACGNRDINQLEGNGPKDERATVVEASVANFNFIFEISNLKYPGIYVHVASNSLLGGLWGPWCPPNDLRGHN